MAPLKSIEDSKWAEVKHINCYATFMGYLCMAMRGLGFLVVTWTTVVLLGGFVSTLEKKDFWCLAVITLVQTAGVFNIHVSENLTAVPKLCFGFLSTMNKTITREGGLVRRNEKPLMPCLPAPNGRFSVRARKLAALGVAFVQAMVFGMILCPLAALYGFGLHITTDISLWRLVEHDYGTSSEGDAANRNRKPAIYVLYVLAVFQGAVFYYRKILGFVGKRVAKQVAELYKFDQSASSSVMGYLDVVRIGCEKDPSFAKGRNLITYAAELMESESQSPDELLSGTRILDTLIKYEDNLTSTRDNDRKKGKRMAVMRELLTGSSSSGKIVQKLLRALDSRSACDAEMKKLAARIVQRLAADIRLKQFPEAIESMYSLLDASQQKANGGFRELLHQGLLMVEKIVQNEENTGLIWTWQRTEWLSFGILWPVSSRLLHRVNHETWFEVVDAALQAMCSWLATARGQFSTSLRQYVSGNLEAIREMEYILTCPLCHEKRKILAMKVLITQLGGDQESKRNIIEQLLGIFLDYDKDGFTKELAGEKLVALTQESRINADIILQGDKYVGGIVIVLRIHRRYECRVIAAGILEGLCRHYVADDECFRDLKRLVTTDLMPEVLTLISGRHTHTSVYSEKKLQVALLSLWVMVYDKLIFTSQDLPPLFGKVASQDPDFNFARKIKELVRINSSIVPMEADCLRILRSVAKMVVSIIRMRHLHTYVHKRELEPILSSLQDAYRKMDELDGYLLLSGEYSTDTLTGMLFRAWAEFRRWTDPEDREPPNKGKEPEIIEVPGPSMVSHNPQAQLHLAATGEDREAAPNKGKELEIFEPSGAGHSMVSLAKSQFHYPPENAENRQAPTKGKESENAAAPGPSMVSLANAQFQYLPQNAENHQAPTKGKESENVETPWPSNMEQDQCSLC